MFGRQVLHHRRGHARTVDDDVVIGRVDRAADGALLELHDVLRERARLVRKDVLDLAEFFIQVRSSGAGRRVRLGMIHFHIIIDERRL